MEDVFCVKGTTTKHMLSSTKTNYMKESVCSSSIGAGHGDPVLRVVATESGEKVKHFSSWYPGPALLISTAPAHRPPLPA